MQRQNRGYYQAWGRGLSGPMFMTQDQIEAQSKGVVNTYGDGTYQAGLIERAKTRGGRYEEELATKIIPQFAEIVSMLEGIKRVGLELEIRQIGSRRWRVGIPELYVVIHPGRIKRTWQYWEPTAFAALAKLANRLSHYTILGYWIQDEFVEVNLFKQV